MRTKSVVVNLALCLFITGCSSGKAYFYSGTVAGALGDFDRAESQLSTALLLLKSENADPALLADCFFRLGDVKARKYEYKNAHELFQQAATTLADAPASRRTAAIWASLAASEYSIGLLEEAVTAANHSIEQFKDPGKDEARDYASAKHVLGRVSLEKDKDIAAAETHFGLAVALLEKTGNEKTIGEVECLGGLGSCCILRKEYEQAEVVLNRALALSKEISANGHGAAIMNGLGMLNLYQGKIHEAEPFFDEARAALLEAKRRLGDTLMVQALNGKAFCLYSAGKASEAKPLMEEAVDLLQRSPRPDEAQLAKLLLDLGCTCRSLGDNEAARKNFKQSFEIFGRVAGSDAEPTKRAESALASLPK